MMIKWETLNKIQTIMQCKRCQRYGHAAPNCNMSYRCVKCSIPHGPGECNVAKKDNQNTIYCTLCKKLGHPASYKGCEKYKEMVQNINIKKDTMFKKKEQIPINTNNYIKQNLKFNELFKEVTAKQPTITNKTVEKTDDIILIKNTLIEILNKINKIENDTINTKRINELFNKYN